MYTATHREGSPRAGTPVGPSGDCARPAAARLFGAVTPTPDDPTSEPADPPAFTVPPPSPLSLAPPKSRGYRSAFADRFGDERTVVNVALFAFLGLAPVFMFVSALLANLLEVPDSLQWPVIVIGGLGLAGGVGWAAMRLARGGAFGLARFTLPDGGTTPYQRTYSHIEAIAARGQVDEALLAYEAELRSAPNDIDLLARAADLYLAHKRQPARAADLLRLIRRVPGAPPARVLYASQRLVDLYLGALDDRGKALVELRMIVDRFPGSPAAAFAREGLDKLRREHHGGA